MKLVERSFSNNVFRPRPLVLGQEDGQNLICLTTWGDAEAGRKIAEEVEKYISSAKEDGEVTSVFAPIQNVSDRCNVLRAGILMANQLYYRSEGRGEYVNAFEILALSRSEGSISWAKIGQPNIYVGRKSKSILPVHVVGDLVATVNGNSSAPLPAIFFGHENSCAVSCGDLQVASGDKLILQAGSVVPQSFWLQNSNDLSLESVSRSLVSDELIAPFWLGIIEF